MSILANKDTRAVIIGGIAGVNAAKRMAQFDFLINRPLTVQAFVYPPEEGQQKEIYRGGELNNVTVYSSLAKALEENPQINTRLSTSVHPVRTSQQKRRLMQKGSSLLP